MTETPSTGFRERPKIIWDDRFVWSRAAFGSAAACWTLAGPFLGSLPPVALVVVVLIAAAGLAAGRFDALAKLAAAAALAVACLGWRIAWNDGDGAGDVTVAVVSALPPAWLVWYGFYLVREDGDAALWRAPHAVSAGMACCAVVACAAWSVGLWALGQAGAGDFRFLQVLLLFVWMGASLWCVNAVAPTLKAAKEKGRDDRAGDERPEVAERLERSEGTTLFGVWLWPWALGAVALVVDVAGRGPFDRILHPEPTTPLWIAVVPAVVGISGMNALRVLAALLSAGRRKTPPPSSGAAS